MPLPLALPPLHCPLPPPASALGLPSFCLTLLLLEPPHRDNSHHRMLTELCLAVHDALCPGLLYSHTLIHLPYKACVENS